MKPFSSTTVRMCPFDFTVKKNYHYLDHSFSMQINIHYSKLRLNLRNLRTNYTQIRDVHVLKYQSSSPLQNSQARGGTNACKNKTGNYIFINFWNEKEKQRKWLLSYSEVLSQASHCINLKFCVFNLNKLKKQRIFF